MSEKRVVCVREGSVDKSWQGWTSIQSWEALNKGLGTEQWALVRNKAEEDPRFRQLIPYVTILTTEGRVLLYRRGKAGNESRLHSLWSIGIGGHVEPEDYMAETMLCWSVLLGPAIRELDEELPDNWLNESDLHLQGVIRASETAVDAVHLGISLTAVIEDSRADELIGSSEAALVGLRWVEVTDLPTYNLETWSKLVYNHCLMPSCKTAEDQYVRDNDGA